MNRPIFIKLQQAPVLLGMDVVGFNSDQPMTFLVNLAHVTAIYPEQDDLPVSFVVLSGLTSPVAVVSLQPIFDALSDTK